MIRPGIYRHFKGNLYRVISLAQHSESEEPHVVYQTTYGDKGMWIRPLSMFDELINRDGKTMRRFARVEDQRESLELIHLQSEAGQSSQFETDFDEVSELLTLQKAYLAHELRRMQGRGDRYLLRINWLVSKLDDETLGVNRFTSASDLQQWQAYLNRYQIKSTKAVCFDQPIVGSLCD